MMLTIAGCVSPYQPATTGPTAKIQLRSSQPSGAGALMFSDEHCGGKRSIAASLEGQWLDVPAGERIWMKRYVNSAGLPFGRYCESLVTFVPADRQSYVVDFTLDAAGCRTQVSKLAADNSQERETGAAPFDHPDCR